MRSRRTRFLMPVHLYGQLADMRRLKSVAAGRSVAILEDSCQAHGATRDGIRAGQGGLAGAFSFYPAKNLGAMGDAGALVTDDEQLAHEVRCLREHGQREKYRHAREGYTSRLDTIQAIVLLHKLPHLERWNEERRALARLYGDTLAGVGDLACRLSHRAASRPGTSTSSGPKIRRRWPASCASEASRRAGTTPSLRTSLPRTRPRPRTRRVPGRGGALP